MTTIEIEDYYGNTLMSFRIKGNIKIDDFCLFGDCEIADIDKDYINNTDEQLIRVQSTQEKLKYGDFDGVN